jgi:hypothetical protein
VRLNWLVAFFTCPHEHVGWPQRRTQSCLDCGATRHYILGGRIGRWHKRPQPQQDARELVERRLAETM